MPSLSKRCSTFPGGRAENVKSQGCSLSCVVERNENHVECLIHTKKSDIPVEPGSMRTVYTSEAGCTKIRQTCQLTSPQNRDHRVVKQTSAQNHSLSARLTHPKLRQHYNSIPSVSASLVAFTKSCCRSALSRSNHLPPTSPSGRSFGR
jgi:hypothetical protein